MRTTGRGRFPASATGGVDRPRRPGAGGQRGEPDGPDVHRRPLGRLAVRGAAPGRAGESADVGRPRRRAARCAAPTSPPSVRCAPPDNKPTTGERDDCLPYLDRELALLGRRAGDGRARLVRLGRRRCARCGRAGARSRGRSRGSGTAPRRRSGPLHADRLLPPEPAEHVHRQADRGDARRRPRRAKELAAASRLRRPCIGRGYLSRRVPAEPPERADDAAHPRGAGAWSSRCSTRRRTATLIAGDRLRAGGAHRRARRLHRPLAATRSRPSAS